MINFLNDKPILTMGNFSFINDDRGSTRPINIIYYKKPCSIHPFFKREAVRGDLLDTCFKRFYGDIDLSLRFWANGGTVETCPDACITMFNNRDSIKREALTNYSMKDEMEFHKKWDDYDFNMRSDKTPTYRV